MYQVKKWTKENHEPLQHKQTERKNNKNSNGKTVAS